ncbi:DUF4185 domain-containing protein [Nocardia fluminea]|uniref:DUF4185 domain-containing protein n=1 Tax=Nocardia fluminea TaxID=134984 RepID=UPI0036707BB8
MRVTDLNPVPSADLGGGDLAIPFELPNGDVGFIWGDSFSGDGPYGPPMSGIGNWRSPIITRTSQRDPAEPIVMATSPVTDGRQLWDYQHDNAEYSTVLPCDAMTIDGRIYLWVMYTQGLGNEKWCEVWTSDDSGISWARSGSKFWCGAFAGKRVMISWAKDPHSDWVHIISTGGLDRNKDMLLWRVTVEGLSDPHAWQGWGWDGRNWAWNREPTPILPGWRFGEICLRYVENRAVISGFDAGDYSIFVKVGDRIDNTNWITTRTHRPITGMPRGVDTVPRLYGGYIHPYSRLEDGKFTLIVSEWAESGNPYRATQFTCTGIRRKVLVPVPDPEPTPEPQPTPPPDPHRTWWQELVRRIDEWRRRPGP